MDNYRKVELLSPAGNPDGFYGAIHGGADAVYLAGDRFGARAYAENFTTEKLVECIRYAHLLGRKIYLTVNTLLKEAELAELYDYLLPFYEAGLDAVIVQDLGVLRFVRENFPGMEIHVSTQMTLCSPDGASLLKSMGASRVVPARELSLQEIIMIKQSANIEVETFIHGAMCYCYSGQCLFSSILGGRSGNRGRCAQPCRLPYSLKAGDVNRRNCYPLSLKDMCTIEHIPQLIEAGIDSFKIEGRMKKPEYTAGVTDVYRRYIDKYYNLREKKGPEEAATAYRVGKEDFSSLNSLYIRSEIHDGYYFKHNGREMVTMTNPAYSGSDETLLVKIHDKYLNEPLRLPITVKGEFETGLPAKVTLEWNGIISEIIGEIVDKAQKQPVSEENVRKQLGKLGDSAFYAKKFEISVGKDAFYPLKQMNELRRMAVSELEEQILLKRGYTNRQNNGAEKATLIEETKSVSNISVPSVKSGKTFVISVRTIAQLEAVIDWTCPKEEPLRIYVDGDLVVQEWPKVSKLCSQLKNNCKVWVALPYILRARDASYLDNLYKKSTESTLIKGFLVRSMDGLGFLQRIGNKLPCRTDAGVYAWNELALKELSNMADGFCLPYELKASEQRNLINKLSCEKIVYSRIPMMITANCLLRTADRCKKNNNEPVVLTDRYNKSFPVLRNCLHCMNIIYNSVPFSLHQELSKWRDLVDLRVDFTLESASEVKQLLDSFGNGAPFLQKEYTTGHEKRGVE